MTKIIMRGCNGKMGRVITEIVRNDADAQIVAGIDIFDDGHNDYPVFENFAKCSVDADVIIDFASTNNFDEFLDYCEEKGVPAVICTTGLSKEQTDRISDASRKTAFLRSANMSLGINTLFKVLKNISPLLAGAGYDIEIVEKHHNQKLDAPSGTALALADAINESLEEDYGYKFDRSKDRAKRPKDEIGISAVRGGTIVGEHEIIFAGEDEVIEIKHTAYSKRIFAKGAVEAAKFLAGKPTGLYTMKDVLD